MSAPGTIPCFSKVGEEILLLVGNKERSKGSKVQKQEEKDQKTIIKRIYLLIHQRKILPQPTFYYYPFSSPIALWFGFYWYIFVYVDGRPPVSHQLCQILHAVALFSRRRLGDKVVAARLT